MRVWKLVVCSGQLRLLSLSGDNFLDLDSNLARHTTVFSQNPIKHWLTKLFVLYLHLEFNNLPLFLMMWGLLNTTAAAIIIFLSDSTYHSYSNHGHNMVKLLFLVWSFGKIVFMEFVEHFGYSGSRLPWQSQRVIFTIALINLVA